MMYVCVNVFIASLSQSVIASSSEAELNVNIRMPTSLNCFGAIIMWLGLGKYQWHLIRFKNSVVRAQEMSDDICLTLASRCDGKG